MTHETPPTPHELLGAAIHDATTAQADKAVNTAMQLALTDFDMLHSRTPLSSTEAQHLTELVHDHGADTVSSAIDLARVMSNRETEEATKTAKLQDAETTLGRATRLGIDQHPNQTVTNAQRRKAILENGLINTHIKEHHHLLKIKQDLHTTTQDNLLDDPFTFWRYEAPEAPIPPTPAPEQPQPQVPEDDIAVPEPSEGDVSFDIEPASEVIAEPHKVHPGGVSHEAQDQSEAEIRLEQERQIAERRALLRQVQQEAEQRAVNRRSEDRLLSGNVYKVSLAIEDPSNPGTMRQVVLPMRSVGQAPSLVVDDGVKQNDGLHPGGKTRLRDRMRIRRKEPKEEHITHKEEMYTMRVLGEALEYPGGFEVDLPIAAFGGVESYNVLDDKGDPRRVERDVRLNMSNGLISGRARDMITMAVLADSLLDQLRRELPVSPVNPRDVTRVINRDYRSAIDEVLKRSERTEIGIRGGEETQENQHKTRKIKDSKKSRIRIPRWQTDREIIGQLFDGERVAKILNEAKP